jgi:MFS family permease
VHRDLSGAVTTPPSASRTWPRGLEALAHRNFRLFWTGQLVSLVGTWMQTVAQGWLLLQLTNSPVALGVAAAFQFTPVLIFGLFGGVVADMLPKRRTLIATQVAEMVLAFALGILVATGTVQVWHVYLLAILLGVVSAVDMPVRQSFVVEMVGRSDVGNAVALNSAVFNASRIVGPAIAGVVIGTVGIATCFLLNGASFAGVIVGLLAMRPEHLLAAPRMALERTWRGVFERLREGLSYVRNTPLILLAIAVLGAVSTFGMNFNVLIPVLARDVLHGDAATFGFLMAASGVGSLASAAMIAVGQRPTPRLLLTGAAVFGIALIALGLSRSFLVSALLMVVLGWGVIAIAATTNTLIQLTVPDVLRGRVMSVYTTVFAGSTPLGGLFAGLVAASAGVQVALVAGGAISALVAALGASRLPHARASVAAHPAPPARPG